MPQKNGPAPRIHLFIYNIKSHPPPAGNQRERTGTVETLQQNRQLLPATGNNPEAPLPDSIRHLPTSSDASLHLPTPPDITRHLPAPPDTTRHHPTPPRHHPTPPRHQPTPPRHLPTPPDTAPTPPDATRHRPTPPDTARPEVSLQEIGLCNENNYIYY